MELSTGTGQQFSDPTPAEIAGVLASLPGGEDSFAILEQDDMVYIQTAGGASEAGFVLEYQEGSLERHYRSTNDELPLETVTRAFQLYAARNPAWKSLTSWEQEDLGLPANVAPEVARDGPASYLLPVLLLIAAVIAVFLWLR